eukprot:1414426-Rhodomonas_salina.1
MRESGTEVGEWAGMILSWFCGMHVVRRCQNVLGGIVVWDAQYGVSIVVRVQGYDATQRAVLMQRYGFEPEEESRVHPHRRLDP